MKYNHKYDTISAIVLAAGLSSRLGRPKQLLMGRQRLLLAEVLETVLNLECLNTILVLGNQAEAVQTALSSEFGLSQKQRSQIRVIVNPEFATGQASSVKAGIRALPEDCQGALFVMGDSAGMDHDLLVSIIQAYEEQEGRRVVRPIYGDRPGGPVIWPRRFFPQLMNLIGDTGGRRLFDQMLASDILDIHFSPEKRPWDIDTEAVYQSWLHQLNTAK